MRLRCTERPHATQYQLLRIEHALILWCLSGMNARRDALATTSAADASTRLSGLRLMFPKAVWCTYRLGRFAQFPKPNVHHNWHRGYLRTPNTIDRHETSVRLSCSIRAGCQPTCQRGSAARINKISHNQDIALIVFQSILDRVLFVLEGR